MPLLSLWKEILPSVLKRLTDNERSALSLSLELGGRNIGKVLLGKFSLESKAAYHRHLIVAKRKCLDYMHGRGLTCVEDLALDVPAQSTGASLMRK
jgi:hypothetical protein